MLILLLGMFWDTCFWQHRFWYLRFNYGMGQKHRLIIPCCLLGKSECFWGLHTLMIIVLMIVSSLLCLTVFSYISHVLPVRWRGNSPCNLCVCWCHWLWQGYVCLFIRKYLHAWTKWKGCNFWVFDLDFDPIVKLSHWIMWLVDLGTTEVMQNLCVNHKG